jgi:hypothetical protein
VKKLILVAPLFLFGCASTERVTGPNGASAYLVKCGNAVKTKCMEKAADLCPNGYTHLDRNGDRYDDLTKIGNVGKLEIKADTTTTMLIQCK